MGMIMHDDVPYGEGTSYTQGTGIAINNNVIAVDADNTPTENSEKPVKSKGVYSALESNSAKSASLLKSTVGWTGKNLLPNKVWAFSLSSGSVGSATYQANANATGFCCKVEKNKDYIISRKSSTDANKRFTVALSENEPVTGGACRVVFANPDETEYSFNSGNYEYVFLYCGLSLTDTDIYPMLRKADIEDPTYEPYHESVEEEIEQIYADNGVLGAKNLCPFPTNGNRTENGVTFTVNSDGSISLSGTATDYIIYTVDSVTGIYNNKININLVDGKKYKLTGCPANGGNNKYTLALRNGISSPFASDMGNGVEYTHVNTNNDISVIIIIFNGQNCNNLTFYPMIRLASDPDDTYVPYAMTNRELMEELTVQESKVTDIISGTIGNTGNHLYKYGKVVQFSLRLDHTTLPEWGNTPIFKIPKGYRPKSPIRCLDLFNTTRNININTDGTVFCSKAITDNAVAFNATWITS